MASSALSTVRSLFLRHPVKSNCLIYGTLFGAGELSQQTLSRQPGQKYDWPAVGRLVIVGATIFGPTYSIWYRYLDRFLPGNTTKVVVAKTLLDQGLIGAFGAFTFFAANSALEGKSSSECIEEGVSKWPRTYLTGWLFWPAAQIINFKFLPTHLRAPYVASVAFIWSNILCYIKRMKTTVLPLDDESLKDNKHIKLI